MAKGGSVIGFTADMVRRDNIQQRHNLFDQRRNIATAGICCDLYEAIAFETVHARFTAKKFEPT